jgi:glycine cleavage system H lipoate-binding protein
MSHIAPPSVEPCVWMAAGLVSYKLCDRDFDCARCPLDVALRGGESAADVHLLPGGGRRSLGFPDDRLYAAGHTWVATGCRPGEPTIRIGLDGFAAALLPRPVAVRCLGRPLEFKRGDVICDIELPVGVLSVRVPVGGHLERENSALREQPDLIVESPYRDGWLVDLIPSGGDTALKGLSNATAAREQTALHLRRFRRRIALHLLADVAAVGPCLADGGEALTSLSEILGGARYLELLREILR